MKPETVLKHAKVFYAELDNASVNGVFTGSLTKIFTGVCELPTSYYTPVKQFLDDFECLEIKERGTRKQPSVVMLLKPPPDVLPDLYVKSSPDALTDRETVAILVAEVESLKAWRKSHRGVDLPEALRTIDRRLAVIEKQLNITPK